MNEKTKIANKNIGTKRAIKTKTESQGEKTEKVKRVKKPVVDKTFTIDERLSNLYDLIDSQMDLFVKGKKIKIGKCTVQFHGDKFYIWLSKGKKLLWEKEAEESGKTYLEIGGFIDTLVKNY